MTQIKSGVELQAAIQELEIRQAAESEILKKSFTEAYNSIKPINLIKSIFHEAVETPDLKKTVVNTTVGVTAGFLSKLLFQGATRNPLKRLLGTALMFGITNLVVKNPEIVRSVVQKISNLTGSKKVSQEEEPV